MSGRIISPTNAPTSILRGSGVWNQAGYWAGVFGNTSTYVQSYSFQALPNGSILSAAGIVESGTQSACVVKIDSTGAVLWARKLRDGANESAIYRVSVNASGIIGFAGVNKLAVPADVLVGELSSNGALLWQKTYNDGSSGFNAPNGAVIDSAGNLYASVDNSSGGSIFKFDATGNLVWSFALNGPTNISYKQLRLNAAENRLHILTDALCTGVVTLDTATGAIVQSIGITAAAQRIIPNGLLISGSTAYVAGSYEQLPGGIWVGAVDMNGPTLSWESLVRAPGMSNLGTNNGQLANWDLTLSGGVLYTLGNLTQNALGPASVSIYPLALAALTGNVQWLRRIQSLPAGLNDNLSAVAVADGALYMGFGAASVPAGGAIQKLALSGAWPATLYSGSVAVTNEVATRTSPGSSVGSLATSLGAAGWVQTGNSIASSTVTVPTTITPVS